MLSRCALTRDAVTFTWSPSTGGAQKNTDTKTPQHCTTTAAHGPRVPASCFSHSSRLDCLQDVLVASASGLVLRVSPGRQFGFVCCRIATYGNSGTMSNWACLLKARSPSERGGKGRAQRTSQTEKPARRGTRDARDAGACRGEPVVAGCSADSRCT